VEASARGRCVKGSFWETHKENWRQALVEFTVSSDMFEGVFVISPQLANSAIIGCQFLISRRVLQKKAKQITTRNQ
jgi:nitrate reductase gamma subunit